MDKTMKEKIICYVIIKHKVKNSNEYFLYAEPITGSFEGLFDMENFVGLDNSDDEIIGMVPAVDDYCIFGNMDADTMEIIGYELGKSYHPDWEQTRKEKISLLKEIRKKKMIKNVDKVNMSLDPAFN